MSDRSIICDGNNLAYAAYYAYKNLQNNGRPVSIVFGMPSMISGIINTLKPHDITVVWDGKRSPHRLALLPEYKHKRNSKMTPEERAAFNKQINTTKVILDCLGIKQAYNENLEGDDLIYLLSEQRRKTFRTTIYSNDKDFHQLIGFNLNVYVSKLKKIIHHKNIEKTYGYTPQNARDYLILTGDKSDNIPGYGGIGPSKAQKFFKEFSGIKHYLKSNKTIKHIDKDKLELLYITGRQLIDLKYYANKFLSFEDIFYLNDYPDIRHDDLKKLCFKYNIKTFMKPDFLNTFKNLIK